jgi:hypothetical protein
MGQIIEDFRIYRCYGIPFKVTRHTNRFRLYFATTGLRCTHPIEDYPLGVVAADFDDAMHYFAPFIRTIVLSAEQMVVS